MEKQQKTLIRAGAIQKLASVESKSELFSFNIFVQGCKRRCRGCSNPQFQPFDGGTEMTVEEIFEPLKKRLDWYSQFTVIGGEPLLQPGGLKELLIQAKELGLETFVYTGYELEDVPKDILELCTYIKTGEYKEELKTPNAETASSNQTLHRLND